MRSLCLRRRRAKMKYSQFPVILLWLSITENGLPLLLLFNHVDFYSFNWRNTSIRPIQQVLKSICSTDIAGTSISEFLRDLLHSYLFDERSWAALLPSAHLPLSVRRGFCRVGPILRVLGGQHTKISQLALLMSLPRAIISSMILRETQANRGQGDPHLVLLRLGSKLVHTTL